MSNPIDLKKGDKVIVTSWNSNKSLCNRIGTITLVCTDGKYYSVLLEGRETDGNYTLYWNQAGVEFTTPTRENRAIIHEKKAEELFKEYNYHKTEAEHLRKFKTDEDFTAYKLDKILKAKDVNKIAEILKELKSSNFL